MRGFRILDPAGRQEPEAGLVNLPKLHLPTIPVTLLVS